MKKILIALLFWAATFSLQATHIVGGGFSYKSVGINQYKFNLTLYFDYINGSQGAKDDYAICHIFRKFDNQYMDSLFIPLEDSSQFFPYTNPNCGTAVNIKTQVLSYGTDFFMDPMVYNSAKGYYMIWERCCRNNTVSNIEFPGSSGQTFYMEFPPVVKLGLPYLNGSPQFVPILADFPCINQNFTLSFAAIDPDGDQLVYSLTNPLMGNSSSTTPRGIPPIPAPYEPVVWIPGFGFDFAIPGSPALKVNPQTGLLTCKASMAGLFVFSVKCEELRNGIKIGEVRKEMQVQVVDCPPNDPPVIVMNNPQGLRLGKDDTLSLKTQGNNFCFPLKLSDIQHDTEISFELKVLQGPTNLQVSNLYFIGNGSDSAQAEVCLPPCSVTPPGQPWKIRLLATDNGCPESYTDTLDIYLDIKPNPLEVPTINLNGVFPDTITLKQTLPLLVPVQALQSQNAGIVVSSSLFTSSGLSFAKEAGMELPSGSGFGTVNSNIVFSGICKIPDDGIIRVQMVVQASQCGEIKYDTINQIFKFLPDRPDLRIFSDYAGSSNQISVSERASIAFKVRATMSDGSLVFIVPEGTLKTQPGYLFPEQLSGLGSASGDFRFDATCDGAGGQYDIMFLARAQSCRDNVLLDTLNYTFNLNYGSDSLGLLPNLLTYNGDELNDVLSLDKIAPNNNCASEFDFVEIFNRWGHRVYYETSRDFVWKPDLSEGLYFYSLHFKRRKPLSSWLQVVRNNISEK